MAAIDIEGGCFCGAIRYSARAEPAGSMICHCRTCRKTAGAPVVDWLSVAKNHVRFIQGAPARFRSSDPVTCTFCPACGTPLTYEHAGSPSEIDVATCTLDDPDAFPPTHHSWLRHDVVWLRFGDGLPTFAESRYAAPATD